MPATPTIIGALLGLGTQMYSNALRKLPYMRRIAPALLFPHLLFFSPSFDLPPRCVPRYVRRPGAWFPLICGGLCLSCSILVGLGVFVGHMSPKCSMVLDLYSVDSGLGAWFACGILGFGPHSFQSFLILQLIVLLVNQPLCMIWRPCCRNGRPFGLDFDFALMVCVSSFLLVSL
jgi:hypothetical protein